MVYRHELAENSSIVKSDISALGMFIQGYFDSLRLEKMCSNITVTLLCPGPVFSNLLAEAFTGKPGEVGW
jgi:short-subunit dehydrogenase